MNTFVLGVMYPVGSLLQGRIADWVGLRWVTAGSGVLLGLVVAVMTVRRRGAALGAPPAPQ